MNHNRPGCVWLERLLLPLKLLLTVLVRLELFTLQYLFFMSLRRVVISTRLIPQIEPDRQLKVQLDCTALDSTPKSILDLNVDLRPVKGSITLLERPRLTRGVQCLSQLRLSKLP